MSDDWIYDYDNNEPLYQMDDDYAVGMDGHIVQNVDGNWGFEPSTGEFHFTSGWNSSGSDSDDDDSSSISTQSKISRQQNRVRYNTSPSNSSSGRSINNNESVGCGVVLTIVSLIIAGAIVGGLKAEISGFLAFILVLFIEIVICVAYFLIRDAMHNSGNSTSSGAPARSGGVSYPTEPDFKERDDDTLFRFCKVRVAKNGEEYYYRTTDSSIKEGDYVIVPDPDGAAGVSAEVVEVRLFARTMVPVPLTEAKYIKKKIDAATYAERIEKADQAKTKTGINVNLTILLIAFLCVVIAVLTAVAVDSQQAKETPVFVEATMTPEPAETSEPTQTQKPTQKPQSTPAESRTVGTEAEELIASTTAEIETMIGTLNDFYEEFSAIDPNELTDEEIHEQEQIWSGYRDDADEKLSELAEKKPLLKYKKTWVALEDAVKQVRNITDYLSDWDYSGDGQYESYDVVEAVNNAKFWILVLELYLDDVYTYYREESDTATPKPQSTPYVGQYVSESQASKWEWQGVWYNYNNTGKKAVGYYYKDSEHAYSIKVDYDTNRIIEVSVTNFGSHYSSSKKTTDSDPYNASDYNNPDFFYDGYYDDFSDYDEAEEYWEEYGD